MEAFFQKLNEKKVFTSVKSINNTLSEIYAVEKKEAANEKKEREKNDRDRKQEARKKKREKADSGPLHKMFVKDKKKTAKGINMLLLGILGVGAVVMFRKQIGEYIGGKVQELKEDLQARIDAGVDDIGKAVKDWARQKFVIDKDKEILKKASAYEGNTVEEKIASIQAERAALDPVTGMIRDGEYNEMIRVLRTGESVRRDDGTNASRGGDSGAGGITSGDLREVRQSVMGSDETALATIDALQTNISKRNEHNDKLAKLRETLKGETDPQERLKLIDLIVEQANAMRKVQEVINSVFESNKELKDAALDARDARYETMGITPPARFQSGGMVTGGAKSPNQASVKDARLLTTTDFGKKKKPLTKLQTGGLVLFQGHGDVPPGHSAPGTDGPGTDMQGKYKPTAEQYWVNEVAKRAEKLAATEGVDLKYQRPTGKYASASNPKSNWSLANKLRREGQAAVELHFDAWGYEGGKYHEGKRGMLTSGKALLPAEKNLQNIFGTHPMSGNGWGTMMLELDPLKYATSRTDQYARMLVDAAKGTGNNNYEEADADSSVLSPNTQPGDLVTTPDTNMQGGGTDLNSLGSIFGPGLGAYFTELFSLLGQELGIGDLFSNIGGGLGGFFGGGGLFSMMFGGQKQQVNAGGNKTTPGGGGASNTYAILCYGTNDFGANTGAIKSKAATMISELQSKGYKVVVVPPNPKLVVQGKKYPGPHNAVKSAAMAASAQVEMGVYSTQDPLHLETSSAKSIHGKYKPAIYVGDSNAVRIKAAGGGGYGNTATAVVGAGGEDILQQIAGIAKAPKPKVTTGGAFSESSIIRELDKRGITDANERAMFLAQMAHETGNFRYDEEIHDGSDYEYRSDLGNTQPGDGKRYKGRGYIQITGRANYKRYGDKIGVDLVNNPELASDPSIAAAVSFEYWNDRVDRNAARRGDIRTVTYNINGGYNGLQDRINKFNKYKAQGLQEGGIVGSSKHVSMASLPSFPALMSPALGVGRSMLSSGGMGSSTASGSNVGGLSGSTAALTPVPDATLSLVLETQEKVRSKGKKKTKVAVINAPSEKQPVVMPGGGGPQLGGLARGGLNIVETRRKVHRVNSGALF